MPSFMGSPVGRVRGSGRGELAALRAYPVEQLLERVGELLDALALERVGDVVVVDADAREVVEEPASPRRGPRSSVSPRTSPWSWNAWIVSSGIVFTVSGPISSSTYMTSR